MDESSNTDAVERALLAIREAIVSGSIGPGERLKISELANRFGLGGMPVREALRTLQGQGFVSIVPNRGAFVRAVDEKFLTDLYEVRAVLEVLAVQRALERLTFANLDELDKLGREHEEAISREDPVAVLSTDKEFHLALFRIAGNDEASRIFQRGWELTSAMNQRFGFATPARLALAAKEKQALLAALRQGDGTQAEAIIKMHSRAGLADLLTRLRGKWIS